MIIDWLKSRFGEKSSWFAIFAVCSAFGVMTLTPEQQSAVATLAAILFVIPEPKKDLKK